MLSHILHISLHLVSIYLGPSGCFYIRMASSVWRTVEVLWCKLGELLLSWCGSRLLCGLGKQRCELLMTLLVSDLRPPSLLCQTICSSCIQSLYNWCVPEFLPGGICPPALNDVGSWRSYSKCILQVLVLVCWEASNVPGLCLLETLVGHEWRHCLCFLSLMALLFVSPS